MVYGAHANIDASVLGDNLEAAGVLGVLDAGTKPARLGGERAAHLRHDGRHDLVLAENAGDVLLDLRGERRIAGKHVLGPEVHSEASAHVKHVDLAAFGVALPDQLHEGSDACHHEVQGDALAPHVAVHHVEPRPVEVGLHHLLAVVAKADAELGRGGARAELSVLAAAHLRVDTDADASVEGVARDVGCPVFRDPRVDARELVPVVGIDGHALFQAEMYLGPRLDGRIDDESRPLAGHSGPFGEFRRATVWEAERSGKSLARDPEGPQRVGELANRRGLETHAATLQKLHVLERWVCLHREAMEKTLARRECGVEVRHLLPNVVLVDEQGQGTRLGDMALTQRGLQCQVLACEPFLPLVALDVV
mmetsp:Transcript_94254/g.266158  ORF Transcript_94254/g.266158 Transcript_94254/m.266158 type:complete len:365 (+) Transcript_94254:748-1842(+)